MLDQSLHDRAGRSWERIQRRKNAKMQGHLGLGTEMQRRRFKGRDEAKQRQQPAETEKHRNRSI